jgi:hypothetical protein
MLSTEQIQVIANKVNKKVDLPIIGEKFEEKIIIFGLNKIDEVLEQELPKDFADLLDDVSDGLEPGSPADLDKIKKHLTSFINKKVNIPILGEKGERTLISLAIDIIIDAMRKNDKLK